MKMLNAFAAVLSLATVVSDYGTARSRLHNTSMLVESSTPTSGGHDTALYATTQSNVQYAESESNGASPGGRDSALA